VSDLLNGLEFLDGQDLLKILLQALVEINLASLFFSFGIPVWSRLVSRFGAKILRDYFPDETQINQVNFERGKLITNFLLDTVRFVYGRGVLFKVSHIAVFFLMVMKDMLSQFWHCGFKYFETYMVFVLKVYSPGGTDSFTPFWRTVAAGVESFVRAMGIPKSIAVCWEQEVDYLDYAPEGLPKVETKGKIRVVFNNVAVTVINLPKELGRIFREAAKQQEMAQKLLEENKYYAMMNKTQNKFDKCIEAINPLTYLKKWRGVSKQNSRQALNDDMAISHCKSDVSDTGKKKNTRQSMVFGFGRIFSTKSVQSTDSTNPTLLNTAENANQDKPLTVDDLKSADADPTKPSSTGTKRKNSITGGINAPNIALPQQLQGAANLFSKIQDTVTDAVTGSTGLMADMKHAIGLSGSEGEAMGGGDAVRGRGNMTNADGSSAKGRRRASLTYGGGDEDDDFALSSSRRLSASGGSRRPSIKQAPWWDEMDLETKEEKEIRRASEQAADPEKLRQQLAESVAAVKAGKKATGEEKSSDEDNSDSDSDDEESDDNGNGDTILDIDAMVAAKKHTDKNQKAKANGGGKSSAAANGKSQTQTDSSTKANPGPSSPTVTNSPSSPKNKGKTAGKILDTKKSGGAGGGEDMFTGFGDEDDDEELDGDGGGPDGTESKNRLNMAMSGSRDTLGSVGPDTSSRVVRRGLNVGDSTGTAGISGVGSAGSGGMVSSRTRNRGGGGVGSGALGLSAEQHLALFSQDQIQKTNLLSRVAGQAGFLPVNPIELDLLCGVVNAFQTQIFLRYQARATSKLFTAIIFLFGPSLASLTSTRDAPGYEPVLGSRIFIAGVTFLITDILEWAVITWLHFKHTKNVHEKIDIYRQLQIKNKMVAFTLVSLAAVIGIFMFNTMWNPFDPKKLSKKLYVLGRDNDGAQPALCGTRIPQYAGSFENSKGEWYNTFSFDSSITYQKPNCYTPEQWQLLGERSEFYGLDHTMWSRSPGQLAENGLSVSGLVAQPSYPSDGEANAISDVSGYWDPKFVITGVDWEDPSKGHIYPEDVKQTLGAYFYRHILEECRSEARR